MAKNRSTDSLEDQLREERRLAAARRRRRRRSWMIPLLVMLLLLLLLFAVLYFTSDHETPAATEAPTEPADTTVTIVAGGDVSLSSAMLTDARNIDGYDFSPFFEQLTRTVAAADLAIVNVEGNFCGAPYSVSTQNDPESLLPALRDCGFDIVQTANSYSIENGLSGLVSTKQTIEAYGLDALGTFESQQARDASGGVLIKEINGMRIALIAWTKGTNGLRIPEGAEYCVNLLFKDYDTKYSKIDREGIVSLLEQAKAASPDLIVCMVHWGSEFSRDVSESQTEIATLMLDNGADLILGTHSHLVGPIEWDATVNDDEVVRKGVVAYSLGDLLCTAERTDAHSGCLLSVTATKHDGITRITDVSYIPTYSAYPDEELGVEHFAVYDTLDAISRYESNHYQRVSETLYHELTEAVEDMKSATKSELLIEK